MVFAILQRLLHNVLEHNATTRCAISPPTGATIMSLQSVASAAKRASATVKAAQSAVAKRGTLCVVERRHSSVRLHPPGRQEWFEYLPAVVRSVSRDGMIREVECGPCRWKHDRIAGFVRSWMTALPGSLMETLGIGGWKSLDEAAAAIKATVGIALAGGRSND
jgi:hypothetical protein